MNNENSKTKCPLALPAATFKYKLIYVFAVEGIPSHKGLLKIGEATYSGFCNPDKLSPNSPDLNLAAMQRIKQYTKTVGITPLLLHTELALRKVENYIFPFSDKHVHKVLENSGIKQKKPNGKSGNEWFQVNLETVKKAIAAVKTGKTSLTSAEIPAPQQAISFREEQQEAINKTLRYFNGGDKNLDMLWYAKMRFGKTLTALEVVRRMQYRSVIIVTHRPVVDTGWHEDFNKIFYPGSSANDYTYETKNNAVVTTADEKIDKANDQKIITLTTFGKHFIYFASMQDLRGSKRVGGTYNKNNAIFDANWDLVIIDEAHEGTQTAIGDSVIKALRKQKTKVLALSGTPYNILADYKDGNLFVWDYVMEQEKKRTWEKLHPGESNPYSDLPDLHIFTYNLAENIVGFTEDNESFFSFSEFFKIDPKDPIGETFIHEADVVTFLNLLTADSYKTYPFSTDRFRNLFRHTLWIVPGVKEARALGKRLRKHPVFKNYGIANVAGNGDTYEEEHTNDALKLVRTTIEKNKYSITLSCGKLTTGVTVKEWTAVLLLAGASSTSAAQYMQTIFRVQSAGTIDGQQKTDCCAFDFAPDRTLRILAEAVPKANSAMRPDSATKKMQRDSLDAFLKYCSVISVSGSHMKEYKIDSLMEQVKQIYAERAVNSGFDDMSIYSDALFQISLTDAKKINFLKSIVGTTESSHRNDVVIAVNGLDVSNLGKKPKPKTNTDHDPNPLTPEQLAYREALKNRRLIISILRGVSIRMPLMIYGASVPLSEDIDIDSFVKLIDNDSWKEFMPSGVTKEIFKGVSKYYDRDVFIAAARRIREFALRADNARPTERMEILATIFSKFRNPDHETVLTPWRVVNRHLAETIGGWCFYDESFDDGTPRDPKRLKTPRFINVPNVTSKIFSSEGRVLEINSKSGLYPLLVAYNFYRIMLGDEAEIAQPHNKLSNIWRTVVMKNIFVLCKTRMAQSITKRTLLGYGDGNINAVCIPNLTDHLKSNPQSITRKLLKGSFWGKDETTMKFEAVVGNPPYQEETAKKESKTNGQKARRNVFQLFQEMSDLLSPDFSSLIYPGGRWIHQSGKGVEAFGKRQINDPHLASVHFFPDASPLFNRVEIEDGVSIVFKRFDKTTHQFDYFYHTKDNLETARIPSPGDALIPLNPNDGTILTKIEKFVTEHGFKSLAERILPRSLFGIESDFVHMNPKNVRKCTDDENFDIEKEIKLFTNDKAGKAGRAMWYIVNRDEIKTNREYIKQWQVVVSSANAGGMKRDWQIALIDNHSAFGRSRVGLGSFKTRAEAENFMKYCRSNIMRYLFLMTGDNLTSLGKRAFDIGDYSSDSKLLDFSSDIDEQLCTMIGLIKKEYAHIISALPNRK